MEVTFDKKPVIIKEKQEIEKKIPGRVYKDEDNWFVLFSQEQIKKKVIATGSFFLNFWFESGKLWSYSTVLLMSEPFLIADQSISSRLHSRDKCLHAEKGQWFKWIGFDDVCIDCTTAGVSDTWILEEKRLREVPKGRLREDVKRSHVVEDRRLHPYVPGPKAEDRHRELIDDWFLLLESVSKISGKRKKKPKQPSMLFWVIFLSRSQILFLFLLFEYLLPVSKDKRAEEDQRRKEELFKKQALAEDRRKVAGKTWLGGKYTPFVFIGKKERFLGKVVWLWLKPLC